MSDPSGSTAATARRPRRTWQALPSWIACGLLLLTGWWGHRTGWSAPAFATLFGGAPTAAEDWCTEHGVPESQCLACHPELRGADPADWCKEHGLPESKCTLCHPDLLQNGVAEDWCAEHGVPESGCTTCHPERAHRGELPPDADAAEVVAAAPGAGAAVPGKDPRTCRKHALRVQFASKASVDKAGVQLGQVTERPMAEAIAVPAETGYDGTRHAKVLARAAGVLRHVEADLGSPIAAGAVLALVDAGEVGRGKAALLAASAGARAAADESRRLDQAAAGGFRSAAERTQAANLAAQEQVRLFEARQALLALGLPLPDGEPSPESVARLGIPDATWQALPAERRSANLLPLPSPLAGVVVARRGVVGEAVAPGDVLFEVADPTQLWLTLHAPPELAGRFQPGQRVLFRPESARDEPREGRIDWIGTAVDDRSRTLPLRASLANPDGRLRANTYGTALVVVRPTRKAIAVPNAAVQWEGCCHVVFVRLADAVFEPRKVRLGARDAACTEILAGVLPGEVVATTGSRVLTAALLKSNLGAGCCDER